MPLFSCPFSVLGENRAAATNPAYTQIENRGPESLGKKQLVVTGGLYGAGTTWTHNVLLKAIKHSGLRVYATYTEDLSPKHFVKVRDRDALLIKAHVLQPSTVAAIRATSATLFIPIRDPRDAVSSLISRFNYSFAKAYGLVEGSVSNILDVQLFLPHVLLKYESGFMQRCESVAEIARAVGLDLTRAESEDIYESLRPDKLKEILAQRKIRGFAQHLPFWKGFDPETHWHKNHVGDGRIGKFRTHFNAGQRHLLNQRFESFLRRFNYPD